MTFLTTLTPFKNGLTIAFIGLALGAFTLVGCDSAGSSSDGSDVEVGFGTTSSSTTAATTLAKADAPLVVTGANGDTLKIDDIRFIVSEVELEGDADSAEFETENPFLVDLPLNSNEVVSVVNGRVPPGTYNEFEFEVEDAELDDDEEEEELQGLRDQIAGTPYAGNWPGAASMVVEGSYTPNGGDSQSFTSYYNAEIEVEIEMEGRTFEVGTDDPARQLNVRLNPSTWFVSDGVVRDLSADQDDEELAELEIEFEKESEVEFDDD